MKNRAPTNPNIDRARFARTASNTKSINLGVKNYRGGIRL